MGAPLPVAAGGAVAPPRPALISTYCQYYQSTLDPHQMPSQVFETYCPDATLWTANLLWYATNPIYPVIFLSLVEQTDWPWLYITPTAVTQQVAGPAGDLGNFTFDADFTDSGAPLGIVGLPNDLQHMAPATTVPTLDQMAALWAVSGRGGGDHRASDNQTLGPSTPCLYRADFGSPSLGCPNKPLALGHSRVAHCGCGSPGCGGLCPFPQLPSQLKCHAPGPQCWQSGPHASRGHGPACCGAHGDGPGCNASPGWPSPAWPSVHSRAWHTDQQYPHRQPPMLLCWQGNSPR